MAFSAGRDGVWDATVEQPWGETVNFLGRRNAWVGTLALALGLLVPAGRAVGQTFEALAQGATEGMDLATLVGPFVDDCAKARRDIDRARCRGMHAQLKRQLPGKSFSAVVDEPGVVLVSEYDARLRGMRMRVFGCLACQRPVVVGAAGEKRFVTLKVPAKGAALPAASEIANTIVDLPNVTAADEWSKTVKPHLRAEFVFQPADAEWTLAAGKGLAFKLLGGRVFNRCSGEVIWSEPKSAEAASRDADDPVCGGGKAVAGGEPASGDGMAQLGMAQINETMAGLRGDIDSCGRKFSQKGTATLAFTVRGNGLVQSVNVEGGLGGTALAECLVDGARKLQFPKFAADKQSFKYPVPFKR